MAAVTDAISNVLKTFAAEFDRRFADYLTAPSEVPQALAEAVRYSALAPGKRVRPYLLTHCCALAGGPRDRAWPAAAAVECIHAFSLIHDDLPAMDNDDLRRGLPTCHKKFGEARAILAGDALTVLAFELLTRATADPAVVGCLVAELARGAGWAGMIGGQEADVAGQSEPPSVETVEYIHVRKTAALFVAACRMGAILGGGDEDSVAALGDYGLELGRAFQIADDLLDLTSSTQALGKKAGKDAAAGKQSYPRCVGTEQARADAEAAVARAKACLARYGQKADDLRALADYVVDRNY